VPMGAVAAARHVHDAIVDAPGDVPGIELFHGYTYSSHALACAAGLATLDVYANEGLFAHARALEAHWEAALHGLAGLPNVIDIRNFGLIGAVELAPRPGQPGVRGQEIFRNLFDSGLLIRVTGDIIALSPPLIITAGQIDELVGRLADGLRQLADGG
jgi:beta-alanine--pyruvate transaminase